MSESFLLNVIYAETRNLILREKRDILENRIK